MSSWIKSKLFSSRTTEAANDNSRSAPAQASNGSVSLEAENVRTSHEGEHQKDFGIVPIFFTKATRKYTFIAAINSMNLGYDIGISNSVGEMIQKDMHLSNLARDFFIGSLHYWSIFGALAACYISDYYGRRRTFLVSAVLILTGLSIMASSYSYKMLIVGRMINGFGVGCGLAIDPLYIAEISPAKGRGEMVNWREIGLNIGLVLGFSTGIVLASLSDNTEWRITFVLGGALPTLMIYLSFCVLPESPRWLIMKNRKAEARTLLRRLYNRRINVDHVVNNIKESLLRDKLSSCAGWDALRNPTPAVRRMLVLGIGMAVAQQMVGVDAVHHYMPDALTRTGIQSDKLRNELMIVLSFVKIGFIVVGGKASDIGGRRNQLFVSLVGMILSLLVLSFVFYSTSNLDPRFTVFGLSLYLSFYSLGMGPSSWLIPAEIFPITIRAKAISVVTCVNRIAATFMTITFVLSNWMSWTTFYLVFAIICICILVFLCIYLPETKGRSLEDMTLYFAEITDDEALLSADKRAHELQQQEQVSEGTGAREGAPTPGRPPTAQRSSGLRGTARWGRIATSGRASGRRAPGRVSGRASATTARPVPVYRSAVAFV